MAEMIWCRVEEVEMVLRDTRGYRLVAVIPSDRWGEDQGEGQHELRKGRELYFERERQSPTQV